MMRLPIYMDYHATTPTDPRVVEAMLPYFTEHFGNPASRGHVFGWRAEQAVERARKQLATLLGGHAKEIVFTSGATESNNLALRGVLEAYRDKGDHIVTAVTEHSSIVDTCKRLSQHGCSITWVPVGRDGVIDPDAVRRAVTSRTVLVSLMAAHNEIGVVQPIAELARAAHEGGALFHTDAAQATGKIPLDVTTADVDLASVSGHKMYGPKGVGALFVRHRTPRIQLAPLICGGGHERGRRSGTLNVPGIVGLGAAAELCRHELADESRRLRRLRDRLLERLQALAGGVHVNGSLEHRLPHNLNISVAGVSGESLLMSIDDIAVSSGSACSSNSIEPSPVLKALGAPDDLARASLRFGLGRFTTEEEVDYVAEKVSSIIRRLRQTWPLADIAEPA